MKRRTTRLHNDNVNNAPRRSSRLRSNDKTRDEMTHEKKPTPSSSELTKRQPLKRRISNGKRGVKRQHVDDNDGPKKILTKKRPRITRCLKNRDNLEEQLAIEHQQQANVAVTPSPANDTQRPVPNYVSDTAVVEKIEIATLSVSSHKNTPTNEACRTTTPSSLFNLPQGVRNIDGSPKTTHCCCGQCDSHCSATECNNLYLYQYGRDYYSHLFKSESKTTLPMTPSAGTTATWSHHNHNITRYLDGQPHLTELMRLILVDWLVEVAEEYKVNANTLHVAVKLVDRVLSRNASNVAKDELQCLGCACMMIACKLEESNPPSADDFCFISDNTYTRKQIVTMERFVCTTLTFHLDGPTPYRFLHRFLTASTESRSHKTLEGLSGYILELSLLRYELVTEKCSLVAAAAVYLARVTLGLGYWNDTLVYYTGYTLDDLEEVVKVLHDAMWHAEMGEYKSVFIKYRHAKYGRVALKTVPRMEDLNLL